MYCTTDVHVIPRNKLLSSMKAAAYERLEPSIETVDLYASQLLSEAGAAPAFVYFPNTAVLSVLREVGDGRFMEVSSIGNEGVNALPMFLGQRRMRTRSQVLNAGSASRIALADFIAASNDDGLLSVALRRYAAFVLADVERAVVCTRFHSIPQQFARWLLYSADRAGSDAFMLTHDCAADLLGVRRATISEAMGVLKRDGIIGSSRGQVVIENRMALRRAACICYQPLKESPLE